MALKLGELLLKAQLISQSQLDRALEEQKNSGGKLGEILQRLAFVTEDDIINELTPIIRSYAQQRSQGETFGDFVIRAVYVAAVYEGKDFHHPPA